MKVIKLKKLLMDNLILFVCSLFVYANGQIHVDRPFETGIGFINGRQVSVDDVVGGRLTGRISHNMQDGVHLHTNPHGVMINSGRPHDFFGPTSQNRFRTCRAATCSLQIIPARCRYTPLLRTALGDYCLGCPENVCDEQRNESPRQRRRLRRLRRRLCRNFGICFNRQSGNPLGIAIP